MSLLKGVLEPTTFPSQSSMGKKHKNISLILLIPFLEMRKMRENGKKWKRKMVRKSPPRKQSRNLGCVSFRELQLGVRVNHGLSFWLFPGFKYEIYYWAHGVTG
jgi:hypothetical protein